MTKERIPIHKRYLVIDSPIKFSLIANNGIDTVYRPAGAWQLDMWQLLTKEYFQQYPVFILELEYDETLLQEGQIIEYRESDINLGTGLAGVNGQIVDIGAESIGLMSAINSIKDSIKSRELKLVSEIFDLKDIYDNYRNRCISLSKELIDKISYNKMTSSTGLYISGNHLSEVTLSSNTATDYEIVTCLMTVDYYDNEYQPFLLLFTKNMVNTTLKSFTISDSETKNNIYFIL